MKVAVFRGGKKITVESETLLEAVELAAPKIFLTTGLTCRLDTTTMDGQMAMVQVTLHSTGNSFMVRAEKL